MGQQATIRGRAFAGNRGIQRVEYSVDDGQTWQDARFDYPGTTLTWTFWALSGRRRNRVRLPSSRGPPTGLACLQSEERRGIVPQGATGLHRVVATVA